LEDTRRFILKNKYLISVIFYGQFVLEKGSYVFNNPEKFGIRLKGPRGIGNDYDYENIKGAKGAYDEFKSFLSKINANKQCFAYLRDIMLIYYSGQNV